MGGRKTGFKIRSKPNLKADPTTHCHRLLASLSLPQGLVLCWALQVSTLIPQSQSPWDR